MLTDGCAFLAKFLWKTLKTFIFFSEDLRTAANVGYIDFVTLRAGHEIEDGMTLIRPDSIAVKKRK
jgi:hypothetical protein